jgi:formylglycine-generating enzyme required for sulfatase activity
MVPIAAGYFIMSGAGVTLTKGFYMGKYEVTQELYQAVMGSNPSSFTTGVTAGEVQEKRPVERVSWYDAIVFCNKLSMLEGLSPVYRISGSTNPANWGVVPTGVWNSVTGQYDIDAAAWDAATVNWAANGYRLPTEAEWEYACRAGTTTTYNLGNSWDDAWGWYAGNSDAKTHEVGKKTPNAWGLYDMHGNVREWVWDWYGSLESGLVNDPTGSASGSDRVARGGDLHNSTTITASWFRNFNSFPYLRNSAIGFRLARNTSNDIGVTSHIMVTIAAGTFSMGSPDTEVNRRDDERQHPVTLTRGFYMGKYEVTQELYQAVMGSNPSTFKTDVTSGEMQERRPVEQVSWYNAIVFCNKLSMMERFTPVYTISGSTDPSTWGSVPTSSNSTWNGITVNWNANGYRLPTEAEWEYACRAGTTTAYHTGAGISDSTGWYSSNSGSKTHEVGKKTTNAWGLYDMHGNVMEWCWDWYGSGYLAAPDAGTDPKGSASGTHRVLRSGNWGGVSMHVRSAYRVFWGNEPTSGYEPSSKNNGVGFRLARNN